MARSNKTADTGKKRKSPTIRERAKKAQVEKPRRIRKGVGRLGSKVKGSSATQRLGNAIENNRLGRLLLARPKIVPGFIRNSWREIKQVTWPNRRETVRLTIAVFIFAVVFAIIVGLLDYVLGKIFKEVILRDG